MDTLTSVAGSQQVGAIVVTYNSGLVAPRAVQALLDGASRPDVIVVVDNSSTNTDYLDAIERLSGIVHVIRLRENIGFCAANNLGLTCLGNDMQVLLINPDAFVTPTFLANAMARLNQEGDIGAIGPKLLGADPTTGNPTGRIDSAGIAQDHWGRFRDRGQGQVDAGQFDIGPEDVTGLCAAAVLVRREALHRIGYLFNERFFMYKEDIDLSFRLRRAGWRTVMDSALEVYHCRGWASNRSEMPVWAKRLSLRNEWRLWWGGWTPERSRWTALPFLVAKTAAVTLGL